MVDTGMIAADILLFRRQVDIPGPGESWDFESDPQGPSYLLTFSDELSKLDERRILGVSVVFFPRGKAGQYEALLQVSYISEQAFHGHVADLMESFDEEVEDDGGV